jgi:hypothetical protein
MDVIANVRHHWTCTQFFIGRFIRVSKTLTWLYFCRALLKCQKILLLCHSCVRVLLNTVLSNMTPFSLKIFVYIWTAFLSVKKVLYMYNKMWQKLCNVLFICAGVVYTNNATRPAWYQRVSQHIGE